MEKVIHLKVARVVSINPDNSPVIERAVLKLAEGKPFNNFLAHINMQGYLKAEPPTIVKVLEFKNKKWVDAAEEAVKGFREALVEALKAPQKAAKEVTDYKALYEEQKKQNESMLDRLEALEGRDPDPDPDPGEDLLGGVNLIREKAAALDISFPPNIKDETLLAKIHEVEPDFEVKK